MNKEETIMSRKVFLIAKEYAEVKRIKNWAQQVKSILASCNLMCWWDKNASTDLPSESVQKCCLVYFIEWRKYNGKKKC